MEVEVEVEVGVSGERGERRPSGKAVMSLQANRAYLDDQTPRRSTRCASFQINGVDPDLPVAHRARRSTDREDPALERDGRRAGHPRARSRVVGGRAAAEQDALQESVEWADGRAG